MSDDNPTQTGDLGEQPEPQVEPREPNPGAVPAAAQDYPWSITCAATGLTNGTAYWFDVAASPLVGGTYSIGNLTVVYREE